MDRKLLNKKKFKVKGILYGNKHKIKPVNNVAKYFDFKPKVLEISNGPISKLAYDKNLKSTIGGNAANNSEGANVVLDLQRNRPSRLRGYSLLER